MRSFTLKSHNGRLRQLITDCGVSTNPQFSDRQNFKALWDTGADGSVISSRVVQKLGLTPFGSTQINHAGGTSTQGRYVVNFHLTNDVNIVNIQVSDAPVQGFDMIIGMDIISLGDFAITNVGGNNWFTFRFPGKAKYDFVVEDTPVALPQSKNSLCKCGSGLKYKRCCMNK